MVHGLLTLGLLTLSGCRAWPISPSGPRLANQRFGLPAHSRAYAANRMAAIESIIEADPIATCVRAIMVDRTIWTGCASDLLRLCAERARDDISRGTGWAKNPRMLAGRLRRAQTFLRTLGIEIAFSREGRAGSRIIRMHTPLENTVSIVSDVGSGQPPPRPAHDGNGRPASAQPCLTSATAADDADGADANAAFCVR